MQTVFHGTHGMRTCFALVAMVSSTSKRPTILSISRNYRSLLLLFTPVFAAVVCAADNDDDDNKYFMIELSSTCNGILSQIHKRTHSVFLNIT